MPTPQMYKRILTISKKVKIDGEAGTLILEDFHPNGV